MIKPPKMNVQFYKEESGKEPVKKWLRELDKNDRKIIGEDIDSVQERWPLGMPVVRPLSKGLWEIRSNLNNRIARIMFIICDGEMILLHAIIKKTQKTPPSDIVIAKKRAVKYKKLY